MARVLRDLRDGELTIKDMSVLRESESAKSQWKKVGGPLKDYSLQHTVRMGWGEDFSESKRDLRPFRLHLDNDSYVLSWGELKDADAAGFFRREDEITRYTLRFLDGRHVTIDTELNEEAQRDMIFRLTTEKHEVILDWYEMMRLGRFV